MTTPPGVRRAVEWLRAEGTSLAFRPRSFVVVTAATFIIMVPLYHEGAWYYDLLASFGADLDIAARRYGFDFAFVLRIVPPIAIILLLRDRLRDYGLGLGQIKSGLALCALFYVLYVPCFIALMLDDSFREYYGGVSRRFDGWGEFLRVEVLSVTVAMIGGEFFYRGFLLFGVKKDYGALPAVLVSIMPYVIGHREKPEIEALGSFPVGLALSYLAVKTGSIWYGVLMHATIAIGFNAAFFAIGE